MARMNHLKKRENVFTIFEDVRKVILENHNNSIEKIVSEIKQYTEQAKVELMVLSQGISDMDKIFIEVRPDL